MSALNKEILAERVIAVERHLKRVDSQLPKSFSDFAPESNASDAVILHLWQAIQIIIDTSMSACIHFHLGTPKSYSDAFVKLAEAGYLEKELAVRLSHAAGFRNRIVHAYEKLDMQKVYNIAHTGPADLISFLASIAKRL
ncbi:MAG: DUF86 domain-containing protein [Parachlamydia sp.]|nr:DUF86 domain-containing protein [Parachlamydia sp.]